MSEQGVLDLRVAEALKRAVGLRNVVAHGYGGIDIESCFKAATSGLDDLEQFALQVSRWANARGA